LNDDLFSFLFTQLTKWRESGKISLANQDVDLAVPFASQDGSTEVGLFVAFSRAYLTANPVVGTGMAPAGHGTVLILRDRTQVFLSCAAAADVEPQSSWPVTQSALTTTSMLPNTFSAPVTAASDPKMLPVK
jgi:hypothetical protein